MPIENRWLLMRVLLSRVSVREKGKKVAPPIPMVPGICQPIRSMEIATSGMELSYSRVESLHERGRSSSSSSLHFYFESLAHV